MTREEANLVILKKLQGLLKQHPDLRFFQALYALNVIDRPDNRFYEESADTLNRIEVFEKKWRYGGA